MGKEANDKTNVQKKTAMKWSEIVNQNIWLSSKVSIPYAGVILVALNHVDRGSHVEAACINYVTVTLFGQKDPIDILSCLKRCSAFDIQWQMENATSIDTVSFFLSFFSEGTEPSQKRQLVSTHHSLCLLSISSLIWKWLESSWCKAINFIHTSDCTGPLNFFGKQYLSS